MKKHSLAGGIWLCIIGGSVATFVFSWITSLRNPSVSGLGLLIFLGVSGLGCIALGILLLVMKTRQNRELDAYYRNHQEVFAPDQTFIAYCRNCGNQMMYQYRDIRKHKDWVPGYIVCNRCFRFMGVDPSKDQPISMQNSNGWGQPVYSQTTPYGTQQIFVQTQPYQQPQSYTQTQQYTQPQPYTQQPQSYPQAQPYVQPQYTGEPVEVPNITNENQ